MTTRVFRRNADHSIRLSLRSAALASAALLALGSQSAWAQQAPADTAEAEPAPEEAITVTGSRIARDGYQAPTPVSVLTTEDIQAQAPGNLADFVNTLPAIAGSTSPTTNIGSLSNGQAGINALNLRALGTNRTLVLLDGQRSVPSSVTGLVDINTFPQELVQRVEIVTGGASAAYGSDAVGGVVNFVLDKNFRGLKAVAESGITEAGDGASYRVALTGGAALFDDRLKLLFSVEHARQYGVDSVDRDWNDGGFFQINNPAYTATNGQPARLVRGGVGPSHVTPGGLITAGPLRGTYFGAIDPATGRATTGQLAFGQVSGTWMVGGDWQYTQDGYASSVSLIPDEDRTGVFTRASYEIAPEIELFGQFSYNRFQGTSLYLQVPSTGLTIRSDNAYLPDSVRTQLAANALPSFTMGTTNIGFPKSGSANTREAYRFVGGARGKFDISGGSWNWDFYYQKGVVESHEQLINIWNVSRLTLATDAVFAPVGNAAGIAAGTIVCRSTLTAPTNGCVPMNRIGIAAASQAALDYVMPDYQPYRDQTIKQDVAALTFSGSLFTLPGGPLAIAFGGEWRREQVNGFVETQFMSGWWAGNYLVNAGKYDVKEGFLEISAPLFEGFELNAAGRYTHYSTSGAVQTWKVGATYQPFEDLRLRGNISRDIRAPNLNELFAAGTARTNSVTVPPTNAADDFIETVTGNLKLAPEVADSWTVGAVFTPSFVPGFAVSVDYYDIKISDAIGNISAQNTVNLCYEQDIQQYCDNITYTAGGDIERILTQPFNFASQEAQGIDIEASYRFLIDDLVSGVPGSFSLRAMATHYIKNLTDNGIDFPSDAAGTNSGSGPPSWVYKVTATYEAEPFTLNLIGRGVSDGKYDNSFIECTTGCPTSTPQHRTINDNRIPGAVYFDLSTAFAFNGLGTEGDIQFTVRNLLNSDPVLVGNGPDSVNVPGYPQTNRQFYDVFGRSFRVSLRLKL
jgi:outer membrane receptor protein involved in Fe transport